MGMHVWGQAHLFWVMELYCIVHDCSCKSKPNAPDYLGFAFLLQNQENLN